MTECYVCQRPIVPGPKGIRYEGTTWGNSSRWTFGPVPVHDDCRMDLKTPHDGKREHAPGYEWRPA